MTNQKTTPIDRTALSEMEMEAARLTANAHYYLRRAVDADNRNVLEDDLKAARARMANAIRLIDGALAREVV